MDDNEFHSQTIAEKGASRHAVTGNVPDRGYMVGGAVDPHGTPFAEQNYSVDSFSVDHVRHHAREIRDTLGANKHLDSDVHQGSWVQGDTVTLDASNQVDDRLASVTMGRERGEKAVYDVAKGEDIDIRPGQHLQGRTGEKPTPADPDAYPGGAHLYQGKHKAGRHKA